MIRVNDTEILEKAILAEMQYHKAESQRDAMIKASEALIIAELVKARAAELGILIKDDASEAQALEQLLAVDVPMPEASEADCRRYYEANLEKFQSTPLLAVRHILLAADPEDDNARIKAADQAIVLLEKLNADIGQFDALAAEFSSCPSAKLGGNLGQITKGQTVPEFERQLFNLSLGLAKRPIESRYGLHLVLIEHRIEGRQLPFSAVEERIADYLNEKVRRKSIAQYVETLISQANIEGFDFSVSDSPLMQ